jgi:hypothetical protein
VRGAEPASPRTAVRVDCMAYLHAVQLVWGAGARRVRQAASADGDVSYRKWVVSRPGYFAYGRGQCCDDCTVDERDVAQAVELVRALCDRPHEMT